MTAPEAEVVWAASLKREEGNWESLLDSASTLYVHGVELDVGRLARGKPGQAHRLAHLSVSARPILAGAKECRSGPNSS